MKDNLPEDRPIAFAPILYLKDVAAAIRFYEKAFDAKKLRSWDNPDGTIHVAEITINTALFHLHDEVARNGELSPLTLGGTTTVIGLFVTDPDAIMAKAILAGATGTSPVQDYEYRYRQGNFTDPFGHHWTVERNC